MRYFIFFHATSLNLAFIFTYRSSQFRHQILIRNTCSVLGVIKFTIEKVYSHT